MDGQLCVTTKPNIRDKVNLRGKDNLHKIYGHLVAIFDFEAIFNLRKPPNGQLASCNM